jgi:hypothetical protein
MDDILTFASVYKIIIISKDSQYAKRNKGFYNIIFAQYEFLLYKQRKCYVISENNT